MLRRFAKWGVVMALMLTLGFHWAFLQSVAWVGMVVNYSQDGSVKEAVVKTFDGKHPCQLCKMVHEGKKSEDKTESKLELKKVDLFSDVANCFYFPPQPVQEFIFASSFPERTHLPLSPPPRTLLA